MWAHSTIRILGYMSYQIPSKNSRVVILRLWIVKIDGNNIDQIVIGIQQNNIVLKIRIRYASAYLISMNF